MSTGRKHKQYLARAYAMGGSTTVPADKARDVINELREHMSYSAIARAAGTSHSYIRLIHRGEIQRVSPDRLAAIVAVHSHRPTDSSHVNARGTRRRLQALHALGYTWKRLSEETNYSLTGLKATVYGKWDVIEGINAESVRVAYERLSMRLPEGATSHERSAIGAARNSARRKGWPPPLAWDDIDRDERPAGGDDHAIDPVVVERILAGDSSIARSATRAERVEVVRRWRADARPINQLENLTGWQPQRYIEEDVA